MEGHVRSVAVLPGAHELGVLDGSLGDGGGRRLLAHHADPVVCPRLLLLVVGEMASGRKKGGAFTRLLSWWCDVLDQRFSCWTGCVGGSGRGPLRGGSEETERNRSTESTCCSVCYSRKTIGRINRPGLTPWCTTDLLPSWLELRVVVN